MVNAPLSWIPKLIYCDANYALGHCGPLFAVIWRDETSVAAARHLQSAFHDWAQKGQKYGLITIIEADAPLPSSEARDAVAEFLKSISDQCAVSAVIFEGAGFRSAAVRAVVTGLTMLAKQAYPHRVFGSVEEAEPWYVDLAPTEWRLESGRFTGSVAGIRALITD